MSESLSSSPNFSKALVCLGIAVGNFAPYTVLMVFSTQLYKQMELNDLGFYILAVVSFANAVMCLVSPGIVFRLGAKRTIILASFGISFWIAGYLLPVICMNTGNMDKGICDKSLISGFLLFVSFIGGGAFSVYMVAIFSYITSWCSEKDMPLTQALFYSIVVCGKVLSSIVFSLTMKSPRAQSIFFMCIAGVSFIASVTFNFIPDARAKDTSKTDELLEKEEMTFKKVVWKKTVDTMKLIVSKKMLLFFPFLLFLSVPFTFAFVHSLSRRQN